MEEQIFLDTKSSNLQMRINITDLRDIEFSIIVNMFRSFENFQKITKQIKADDFTFVVNKKIFEYLVFYANEDNYFGDNSKIVDIALNIFDIYNINPATTIRILEDYTKHRETIFVFFDKEEMENLDADIFELIDFSKERMTNEKEADKNDYNYMNIKIDDEYGEYTAVYFNGFIKEIYTTYIFHLPNEFTDVLDSTIDNIIPYNQKDDFYNGVILDKDNPENIEAIIIKKNISKIQKSKKLMKWIEENCIKKSNLLTNRGELFEYKIFGDFDECNIEIVPAELFEIMKNTFSFNFMKNRIKTLPDNISQSQCSILMLCHNQISEFPKSVYELKELSTLCLHANKLTLIPDDIDRLEKLKHLTISNNAIKELPSCIADMKNLIELDIENTFIEEDSLEYLDLTKMERICFDDRLFEYFIKNIDKLKNIDTINLVHSEYKKDNKIFEGLNLIFDEKNWMEDKDYQGHGCILLSKNNEDII